MTDNVSRVKPLNIASFRNIVRERQRMWGAKRRAYFQDAKVMLDFCERVGDVNKTIRKMTPDQKGWVVFYD